MRLLLRSLVAFALAPGAFALAQDMTIVSRVVRDGGPPETAVSYLSRERIRISHGDGKEAIIDYATGQMITLDGAKKTYYVITNKDLDDMAAKLQERMNSPEMKKAQQQMKDLSPEDQKKIDAATASMFTFDVHKTGTTRKIAGYTCENWTIAMGQLSRSEECVTNELQLPMQPWEMYRRYAESMKSVMAAFAPMAKGMAKMQEQFKQMKGYPLANTTTVDIMGHKSTTVREVVEIKRSPIPASAWAIPAGYSKVDNPMLKAFEPRKGR